MEMLALVLADSLLTGDTSVRDGVLAALRPRGTPTGIAHDPAAGRRPARRSPAQSSPGRRPARRLLPGLTAA